MSCSYLLRFHLVFIDIFLLLFVLLFGHSFSKCVLPLFPLQSKQNHVQYNENYKIAHVTHENALHLRVKSVQIVTSSKSINCSYNAPNPQIPIPIHPIPSLSCCHEGTRTEILSSVVSFRWIEIREWRRNWIIRKSVAGGRERRALHETQSLWSIIALQFFFDSVRDQVWLGSTPHVKELNFCKFQDP